MRLPGSEGESSPIRAERGRCALVHGDRVRAVAELRAAVAGMPTVDPIATLWVRMDLWRALVQTKSADAEPLGEDLAELLGRTGLRPLWLAELEATR
jgi:hypothetical protein